MEATRRFWATAGSGALLAVMAVVLSRPLLLAGVVGVAGWLLLSQYVFLRELTALDASLTVSQEFTSHRCVASELVTLDVRLERDETTSLPVVLAVRPPAGTVSDASDQTVSLGPAETTASTGVDLRPPLAGTYTADPPIALVTDPLGLFRERLLRGEAVTLTVDSPSSESIAVSRGREYLSSFAAAPGSQQGMVPHPSGVRKYTQSDAANRIDWNVTARMNSPHVWEFEVERGQETVVVLDRAASMGGGLAGRTKFDAARQVALGVVDAARERGDEVTLLTVDDDGVSGRFTSGTRTGGHATLRRHLLGLSVPDPGVELPTSDHRLRMDGTGARRLVASDTEFARRLAPFVQDAGRSAASATENDLVTAIRNVRSARARTVQTVILTDDTDPNRVQRAARAAGTRSGDAVVMLTPTVLYTLQREDNLETAYRQYRQFEQFREALDRLPNVAAFEVAPTGQQERVLNARSPETSG